MSKINAQLEMLSENQDNFEKSQSGIAEDESQMTERINYFGEKQEDK